MAFGWLKRAVQSAGRAVVAVTHEVSQGVSSAAELAAKVPVIGNGLHGVLTVAQGPFSFSEAMLKGERIDRAIVKDLKSKVAAYQEIAPYAQTVVSMMPVIGSGIGGAIAASSAMVDGRRIDKALIEGVKNLVPGGPLGKAVFSTVTAAMNGENVIKAGVGSSVDALNLPPQAKAALNVVYKAAKGENIPKAALEEARRYMPPGTEKAYDIAIAVGNGKRLQDVVIKGIKDMAPQQLQVLSGKGQEIIAKTPVFAEVYKTLDSAKQSGFKTGMGLMAHTGVNEQNFTAIRSKLTAAQKVGFDLAASVRTGAVMGKSPPRHLSNKAAAGYFATQGMVGAKPLQKKGMLKAVTKDPAMKQGVVIAVIDIKKNKTFWARVKEWFGMESNVSGDFGDDFGSEYTIDEEHPKQEFGGDFGNDYGEDAELSF